MSATVETPEAEEEAKAGPAATQEDKKSVGEELFLVHLSRHKGEAPSEEDFDFESPRKKARAPSIGEELWYVHCKRNEGMEPDADEDATSKESKMVSKTKKTRTDSKSKPGRCVAKGVLHLRNRDVQKTLIS